MKMIDLHIHTTYSDGTNTVKEILTMAEELGLEVISITDHDTCKAYDELENIKIKDYFSGKIIPGVELKCCYKDRVVEVLGYKINFRKMNEWLQEFYKNRSFATLQTKYFNHFYQAAIQMGLKMSPKEEIQWNSQKDWASITIYKEMKKHLENKEKLPQDLWEDVNVFLKKYCGDKSHPFYIDKREDYPSIQEAIQAIKKAEGLVFLPHLCIYKWIEDKEKYVEEIKCNYGLDGIETYYTTFTQEETEELIRQRKLQQQKLISNPENFQARIEKIKQKVMEYGQDKQQWEQILKLQEEFK